MKGRVNMRVMCKKAKVREMNHPTSGYFNVRLEFSKEDIAVINEHKNPFLCNPDQKIDSLEWYNSLKCYGPSTVYLLAAYLHCGYKPEIDTNNNGERIMVSAFYNDDGELCTEDIPIPSDACVLISNYILDGQYGKAIDYGEKYEWYEMIGNPYPRVTRGNFINTIKELCDAKQSGKIWEFFDTGTEVVDMPLYDPYEDTRNY